MKLLDKVAIITGASSGIGQQTAITFAGHGAHLVLVGRNEGNLKKTEEACKNANAKCEVVLVQADVTLDGDVKKIVEKALEKFKRIDILVNNAGILETGSIENSSMESYDRVMNTNVRSVYFLTMLCTPHLVASKGNIVNVSSVNGIRAFPGVLAYCVSKSAVDQFTRCTALELAPKSVRVNSVNPGVIVTEVHKRGGMSDEQYQQFLERGKTTHALGRVGETREVADAIAFLASDEASFITGASIPVDGGRHAMCPR